jgi:hypothetical protein
VKKQLLLTKDNMWNSIHLFLSKAEFEYLKLRMMPAVEVYKKGGLSKNALPRKCAARKSIKRQVKKEYLRVDTNKNLTDYNVSLAAQSLLVSVGVHLLFLLFVLLTSTSGPSLWLATMTHLITFSRYQMSHLMERVSHRAHHRGIDFMYDPIPKPEGRLSLRFRRSGLSDPVVRQVLNLKPFNDDDDSGGSSNDSIEILEGTLLGDDSAVYRV